MYKINLFLFLLFSFVGCQPVDSGHQQLMLNEYPELYKAVYERNDRALIAFTYDTTAAVSEQAWRALISTPVNGMDGFIEKVKQANTDLAWTALSTKTLTDEQLAKLQEDFKKSPELRAGIVKVLGRSGNRQSLLFLAENMNSIRGSNFEGEAALAIGRLMVRFNLNGESLKELTANMLNVKDPNLLNRYLYGYFRGRKIPPLDFSGELMQRWDSAGVDLKVNLIRILMHNHSDFILEKLNSPVIDSSSSALAVELVNQLTSRDLNPASEASLTGILNHSNRSVVVHALQRVAANDSLMREGGKLIAAMQDLFTDEAADDIVRLEAARSLAALGVWQGDMEVINALANQNPYYFQQVLDIRRFSDSEKMPLTCSGEEWDELRNDELKFFMAGNALTGWWNNLSPDVQEEYLEEVQECVYVIMEQGNRAQVLSVTGLLSDKQVLPDFEYGLLEDMLSRFALPADIEVYQFYGGLLRDRFPERAASLIDSLAAMGNETLNNTFLDQGWDIEGGTVSKREFLQSDWKRLARLGPEPEMRLQTDLGEIRIRLFPHLAPATISGIDSLAAEGYYDDVAFHRVVQNFVIQGGDIETGLGWGGPDYVIPTEASELTYNRAVVGIASAGRDTEGSQFFIMHQPAWHLNGLYTVIGEVVDGMDVVDQIVVGDRVQKLRIR